MSVASSATLVANVQPLNEISVKPPATCLWTAINVLIPPPPREQQTEALTTTPEKTQEHQTDSIPPETTTNLQPDSDTTPMDSPSTEQTDENLVSPPDPPHIITPTPMDSSISLKRSHTTDSDSDNPAHKPIPRRPRMAPKPNITVTRNKAFPPTGNK